MNSTSNFLSLSYDILLQIFGFLPSASDVMSVLKTCKGMYRLESERTIWIEILSKIFVEDCIFAPSFPSLNTMRLADLKSAAIGSSRFPSLLEKSEPNSTLNPVTKLTIRLPNFIHNIDHIFLVPGGRYLVVESESNLSLWDLSPLPNGPWLLANIATETEGLPKECKRLEVSMTSDSFGLRILLIFTKYAESGDENWVDSTVEIWSSHFIIYDIYPLSPIPTFTKMVDEHISHIRFGIRYCLSGDYLVVLPFRNFAKVWNIVEDKLIQVNLRYYQLDKVLDLFNVFINGDALGVVSHEEIYLWRTFELFLSAEDSDFVSDSQGLRPSHDIHITLKEHPSASPGAFTRLSDWYGNIGDVFPFTFEWVYEEYKQDRLGGKYRLDARRYQLNLKQILQEKQDLDESTFHDHGLVSHYDYYVEGAQGNLPYPQFEYQLCGSRLLAAQVTPGVGKIVIYAGRTHFLSPAWLDSGWNRYTLLEDKPCQWTYLQFSLCPFSGRLCVQLDPLSSGELLILDYLETSQR